MRTVLRTFASAPPLVTEGRLFRLVAEDGHEVYVMPVMYGYRVQSMRAGDIGPRLDWCAGADLHLVALLLEVMEHLLTYYDDDVLPKFSEIRPVHLDLHFMGALASLTDPCRTRRHYYTQLGTLGSLRDQYHRHMLPNSEEFFKAVGALGT